FWANVTTRLQSGLPGQTRGWPEPSSIVAVTVRRPPTARFHVEAESTIRTTVNANGTDWIGPAEPVADAVIDTMPAFEPVTEIEATPDAAVRVPSPVTAPVPPVC